MPKKRNRLVEFVNNAIGRRRRSEGTNSIGGNTGMKSNKSCPDLADPKGVFSDIHDQSELDSTAGMGFLSLLDESERQIFVNRMEGNRRDANRSTLPPSIVTELVTLTTIFPTLPKEDLRILIPQFKGNCRAIYDHLLESGFPCDPEIEHNPDVFINSHDIHYDTLYYHGRADGKESFAELYEQKDAGEFLTFYRITHTEEFQYYLCYKNILDNIVEKLIQGPVVPDGLKAMLDLTGHVPYDQDIASLSIPLLHTIVD